MSKSVLVIDTPKNAVHAICADSHLIRNIAEGKRKILRTRALSQIGVHLWIYQRKTMEIIHLIHLTQDLQKDGMSALMRLQEEWINGMCKEMR